MILASWSTLPFLLLGILSQTISASVRCSANKIVPESDAATSAQYGVLAGTGVETIESLSKLTFESRKELIDLYLRKSCEDYLAIEAIIRSNLIDVTTMPLRTFQSLAKSHSSILNWAAETGQASLVNFFIKTGKGSLTELEYAFFIATVNGHLEISGLLLGQGVKATVFDNLALCAVSESGQTEVVRFLLNHGVDVNARNNCAIRAAASYGHFEIVRILASAGADINSALYTACEHGHLQIVEFLTNSGADSVSARVQAAVYGHTSVVKFFYNRRLELPANVLNTVIHQVVIKGYNEILVIILARSPIIRSRGKLLLNLAISSDRFAVTKILLDAGIKPSSSVLFNAIAHASIETIQLLLEYDAQLDLDPDCKRIILSKPRVASFFLDRGLINQTIYESLTDEDRLCIAARTGKLEDIENLVNEQNVDIHYNDDYAMLAAAENGHLAVLQFLLRKGANIHADEDIATSLAAKNGHTEILQLLVEHGAFVDGRENDALMSATLQNQLDAVKYLVSLNRHRSEDLDRAIGIAQRAGHSEMLRILVNARFFETPISQIDSISARGALRVAVLAKLLDVIKFVLETGDNDAGDVDAALLWAASTGNINTVLESIKFRKP